MKASVLILAASFVCLAAAQCSYSSPAGKVDLSAVPTATLSIDQVIYGAKTPYEWVINLCAAVNQPPAGISSCTDGCGYISQYSSTACETTWTTQTQGWAYDSTKGAGTASFTNSKGWLATVYVGCGSTFELKAAGPVQVSDSLAFTFLLTTSAACGGPPPHPPRPPRPPRPTPLPPAPVNKACDIGGSSVSQLGPVVLKFNQNYKGFIQPFEWVIDLCQGTRLAPSTNAFGCQNNNPGYITQYSLQPDCMMVFDVNTGYSIVNGMWTAKYASSYGGNMNATVIGKCGTDPTIKSVGPAFVREVGHDLYDMVITLVSKVFCLTKTPAPSPLPPPTTAPSPPATKGTVTRLTCLNQGCRQCTGTVLPIGSCIPDGESAPTYSQMALSCSSQNVTMKMWSTSNTCDSYGSQSVFLVGQCMRFGHNDYRFYTCSP